MYSPVSRPASARLIARLGMIEGLPRISISIFAYAPDSRAAKPSEAASVAASFPANMSSRTNWFTPPSSVPSSSGSTAFTEVSDTVGASPRDGRPRD